MMNHMSGVRWSQCHALLGCVVAVLLGCDYAGQSRPESPPEVAEPRSEEKPEAASPARDPAAAARLERVRRSLEQGLDPNKADRDGRTALMMAAFEGHTDVVELLLDHGAEVDYRDSVGRTAVMYGSSGPFPKTVGLLIRRGAAVNLADTVEGWTALMVAAAEGHRSVVEVLLRHGADIRVTDQDGDAAIDHARQRGKEDIVALLESWPEEP